jgi:hypothetical protein
MHAHDGADIAGQVPSAGRDGQIFARVETIGVDHKVAVVLVDMRRLASVAAVEELRQGLALNVVDGVHVEPGAVARQHDGVRLGDEVFASSILYALFRLDLGDSTIGALGGGVIPVLLSGLSFLGGVAHLLVFLSN